MTINKSYQRLNGRDVITDPKTPKSNRTITMPDFLNDEIRDYLRVTSPKLWMLIAAVLVLLAGFLAYLSVAEKEITVPVRVKVENVQMDITHLMQEGT